MAIIITDRPEPRSDGQQALLDLLTWTSPAWPIGAFVFSGGLEWACEAGYLPDADAAQRWIATLIDKGPVWTDAVMLVHAYRATIAKDRDAMGNVAATAAGCATSAERRLETVAQGAAFRRIARATFGVPSLALLDEVGDDTLAYPVAFACLAAARNVAMEAALAAFLHGVIANLVSAALRLVPLGQTEGQQIIHALRPLLSTVVERASALPTDDPFDHIGGAALIADLGTMAHETQYTRLFRT